MSRHSGILIPSSYKKTPVNNDKKSECHDAKIKYLFPNDGEEEFVLMKVLSCLVENDDRDKTLLNSFYLTNFEEMENDFFFILSSSLEDELTAVRAEESTDDDGKENELYLHAYSYKIDDYFSLFKYCCFRID